MNGPHRVGNAGLLPEVEGETGDASFDFAESVDTRDRVDTRKSRAIDTTEDSTVTALFNVALDVDALETVQASSNRAGN